jgi:hypothetical protein
MARTKASADVTYYHVVVRDANDAVLYSKVRHGSANALLREAQRRFPDWHSVDVVVYANVLHVTDRR